MHRRRERPMARHTDIPDKTFVARLHQGFYGPARPHRGLPALLVDQVVKLDQVDVVDTQPRERAFEARARLGTTPFGRLRRKKDLGAMLSEPTRQVQLGIAVPGRRVDMVDTFALEQRQRLFDPSRLHGRQRGRAEKHPRTLESRCPKSTFHQHHESLAGP